MQLKDDVSEIPNLLNTKKFIPQTTPYVQTEDKVGLAHHRTASTEWS